MGGGACRGCLCSGVLELGSWKNTSGFLTAAAFNRTIFFFFVNAVHFSSLHWESFYRRAQASRVQTVLQELSHNPGPGTRLSAAGTRVTPVLGGSRGGGGGGGPQCLRHPRRGRGKAAFHHWRRRPLIKLLGAHSLAQSLRCALPQATAATHATHRPGRTSATTLFAWPPAPDPAVNTRTGLEGTPPRAAAVASPRAGLAVARHHGAPAQAGRAPGQRRLLWPSRPLVPLYLQQH